MTSYAKMFGAAGLLCLPFLLSTAPVIADENYPQRPVTIVVPFAPGGGADNLVRLVAPHLSERLGQEFVIENRGGGGSAIGSVHVIQAPADGYTLLSHSSSAAINTALYGELPYDLFGDLHPISLLASGPVVLVVHPDSGYESLDELLDAARAEPGSIVFSTGGPGSPPHLALELMMSVTDTEFVAQHYRGAGPATVDLLGGHVTAMFSGVSQSREHIDAGSLRAIGITGAERNAALPDVPTMAELGYEGVSAAGTFWGMLARRGTPQAIIDRLNAELVEIMKTPELVERLTQLGYVARTTTPQGYEDHIRGEIELWTRVVEEANIQVEQ
ncbi:MAG: tripartite tricarboxylate transporter substrate binding protein [Salinarimonadaceae bacterium]|nr:MAG: tripartite tricarboxylate transporter substrate binding protein [Salinarimonadaceae bacterium]